MDSSFELTTYAFFGLGYWWRFWQKKLQSFCNLIICCKFNKISFFINVEIFSCKFWSEDFVNGTKWNCVKFALSEKYKNFADFFCLNLRQFPGWKKADVVNWNELSMPFTIKVCATKYEFLSSQKVVRILSDTC